MLKDLLIKNRSYRKYEERERLTKEDLLELIDYTRYTASTVNFQALKFKPVCEKEDNEAMFSFLRFAGLLKGKGTPPEGMRPTCYIIILCDSGIAKDLKYDAGIAAQTILLGAVEKGFGGCMLGSIERDKVFDYFRIDKERFTIELVIALGKPDENIILTEVGDDGSTAYYRDEDGNHYVPKRKLEDIIL
ncbi:MAG: nitroreductase family protein [Clostridia bacterium]|nr:nitroreductase family protein [Clostridia bacterium]